MVSDTFKDRLDTAFENYPGQRRGLAKRIADKCHVSDQAVGRWRRTGKIQRENLGPLAEELGISLEWLLTGRGAMRRKEVTDVDVVIVGDTSKGVDPRRIARDTKPGDRIVQIASSAGKAFAVRVSQSPDLFPRYQEGEIVVVSSERELVPGSDVYVQRKAGAKREASIYRLAWERMGEAALDPVSSQPGDGRIVVDTAQVEICRPVVAILPPASISVVDGQ